MRNDIEKFNHTVSVLVKAYLNNTLEHLNCHACAIGNLVAHANGCSYRTTSSLISFKNGEPFPMKWFDPIWGEVNPDLISPEAANEAHSIGYSFDEINKIEKAFEKHAILIATRDDDSMFKGLLAVVDVLSEIHNIDLKTKEESKLLFVKS